MTRPQAALLHMGAGLQTCLPACQTFLGACPATACLLTKNALKTHTHTPAHLTLTWLQVVTEEKSKLQAQVHSLSSKLAQKEARLRGSVDALAQASYKLRASFTAEVRPGECC